MSAAVACCFKTLLRLFEILIDTWLLQWERFSPRYVPLGLAEKVTALSYSTIKSYVHWQLFQLEINRVNIIPSGGKHIVWCHKVLTDNISIKGWMGTIKQCLIKWPLFVCVCVCVCVCVLKGAFKTTAPFNQNEMFSPPQRACICSDNSFVLWSLWGARPSWKSWKVTFSL